MTDYTSLVNELQIARAAYRRTKRDAAEDVRLEYEPMITRAIQERTIAAAALFAERIREAVNSGMPQSLIRKQVLRTNDWDTWVYWRDLANVDPERVVQDRKRQEAAVPYRWDEDNPDVLLWLKDKKGKNLEEPLRAIVDHKSYGYPDVDRSQDEYRKKFYGYTEFVHMTGEVIKARFEGDN